MLRRGAVPLAVEGAFVHASRRTSEPQPTVPLHNPVPSSVGPQTSPFVSSASDTFSSSPTTRMVPVPLSASPHMPAPQATPSSSALSVSDQSHQAGVPVAASGVDVDPSDRHDHTASSRASAEEVKAHGSCSDFIADSAFEWTLTSLHLDRARQAAGLVEVETSPMNHSRPGQYVVAWRILTSQDRVAEQDREQLGTPPDTHSRYVRRAASSRPASRAGKQKVHLEELRDLGNVPSSGTSTASDHMEPSRSAHLDGEGNDGEQGGNWSKKRQMWTPQANQLMWMLSSTSVPEDRQEKRMSRLDDRVLGSRGHGFGQLPPERRDQLTPGTSQRRMGEDQSAIQAAEVEVSERFSSVVRSEGVTVFTLRSSFEVAAGYRLATTR